MISVLLWLKRTEDYRILVVGQGGGGLGGERLGGELGGERLCSRLFQHYRRRGQCSLHD